MSEKKLEIELIYFHIIISFNYSNQERKYRKQKTCSVAIDCTASLEVLRVSIFSGRSLYWESSANMRLSSLNSRSVPSGS